MIVKEFSLTQTSNWTLCGRSTSEKRSVVGDTGLEQSLNTREIATSGGVRA
ncbi:MAG: hypothetical protein ACI9G1_003889, partial [Pirellulaceae bacterium]